MAYAEVQTKEVHVGAVAGTTIAVTMNSAYTPGNLAQVWAHDGDNTHTTDFPTCADDRGAGNTYPEVTACRLNDAVNNNKTTGHYAKNLAGSGAPTVTLTWVNSNTFRSIVTSELSGLDTANPLIAGIGNKQNALGVGTDNIVSGNINFTAQPAVLCGIGHDDGSGVTTPGRGTGFSDGGIVSDGGAGVHFRWEHKRITATGNAQATLNAGATSDFNTMAMGFLEALSGSQTPLAVAKPLLMTLQRDGAKFRAAPIPSYVRDAIPPEVFAPIPGNTQHPIMARFEPRFGRLPLGRPAVVGSDGSINGTASFTLGALTISSPDGTVLVTGNGTLNLGALTLTTAGVVLVQGNGTLNLGVLTTTTDVDVIVGGSSTVTFGALTLTSDVDVIVGGSYTTSFGALTLSADGVLPIAGTGTLNLGALTLTTAGQVFVVGTATLSLGALTLTTDVDVLVQGDATANLGTLTLTADGSVGSSTATGDANFTLGVLTVTTAGVVLVLGNASLNLGALSLSADGIATNVNGDADLTLGAMTLSATGTSGGAVLIADTSGGPDREVEEDRYFKASAKAARERYKKSGQVPGAVTPGTQVAGADSLVEVESATSVKDTERATPATDPAVIAAFDVLAEQYAREKTNRMKIAAAIAAAITVLEEEEA